MGILEAEKGLGATIAGLSELQRGASHKGEIRPELCQNSLLIYFLYCKQTPYHR
jgi:hypothetical protein